jgi:hypothetical protein
MEPLRADFPFARSLILMRTERTIKKTGAATESHYYLSSLPPEHCRPPQWLGLIRGHWAGAEVRKHWRRDALMGEPLSRGFSAARARTTRGPPRPMLCPPLLRIASKQKTLRRRAYCGRLAAEPSP